MGQGQESGQIVAPGGDGLGHAGLSPGHEMEVLGVAAHQQNHFDPRHQGEEAILPARRAFGAGWAVAAMAVDAGIAESHRQDGDPRDVVESIAIEGEPVAQAIAAGVVPGDAGLMHLGARRLADDQEPRGGGDPEDRPGPQRQMVLADPAGPRLEREALKPTAPRLTDH